MNLDSIKLTVQIIFAVAVILMAIVSLLTAYVFIRYGRSTSITILTSIVFGGVFFLGTLTAYLSLLKIF
ncbi:MAG TPA: hypothetical protein VHQ20_02200 [Patescibacteria group bacterium]|jgi:TRAP-type C4-dicarboxylate transport system permease small subunit|nr:hypothetical protein [Patescibacteria group bacterium]